MHPAFDPLAGTPYRTLGPLSAGGMGEVVLAERRGRRGQVVVKLLHARLAGRPDLAERMRLEGRVLARVRHGNVVTALDAGTTQDGRPFVVFERLVGRTLRDELAARCVLPPAEAAELAIQALTGLGAVHAAGVVHRDLKLDNVFVCDPVEAGARRVVKLLDFGVAKVIAPPAGGRIELLSAPTDEGVALGTPRFFSPEQAAGDPVDPRTDVYAMGMVLYALLAGRGPFEHLTELGEVLDAHLWIAPEPPSRFAPHPIPRALEAVVLRALEKPPSQRFASAAAFAAALAPFSPAESRSGVAAFFLKLVGSSIGS